MITKVSIVRVSVLIVLIGLLISGGVTSLVAKPKKPKRTPAPQESPTTHAPTVSKVDTVRKAIPDSVKIVRTINDSVSHVDSTSIVEARKDSIPNIFWEKGIFSTRQTAYGSMDSTRIQNIVYKDFGNVLANLPGWFYYDRGYVGQLAYASYLGNPTRQSSVIFDGHPLYDPQTRQVDLTILPVESIEQIRNSDDDAANNALLIDSDKRVDKLPYTRVLFHNASALLSNTDVIFRQQFTPNWDASFNVGLKRSFDRLQEEPNELHQGRVYVKYHGHHKWNAFYGLLYNRNKRHDFGPDSLNEHYVSPATFTTNTRYDHTIGLRGVLGNGIVPNWGLYMYGTTIHSDLNDREHNIFAGNDYAYLGVRAAYDVPWNQHQFQVAGRLEQQWISDIFVKSTRSAFFQFAINDKVVLSDVMDVKGKLALVRDTGQAGANASIEWSLLWDENFKTVAEIKRNMIVPTLWQQEYHNKSLRQPADLPVAYQSEMRMGIHWMPVRWLNLQSVLFGSTIDKPVFYIGSNNNTFVLAELSESVHSVGSDIRMNATFHSMAGVDIDARLFNTSYSWYNEIPSTAIHAGMWYRNSFFQDDLKALLRFDIHYWGERSYTFVHPYNELIYFDQMPDDFILNLTIDLTIMKSARVFFAYENLLNRDYQFVYGYPMTSYKFHYGVRWEFWN
ncbi:hypothetical protein JW960_06500 [candidate division KSB1 bacterium]|nr:hypothetical protein [candidate division KSB1 bacterium]